MCALALEPVSGTTFTTLMQPLALAILLFMGFFGTFIANTIFVRVVRDWGAPRAGLYSFVSRVVALIPTPSLSEPLTWREIAAAAIMLGAAAIAIARRPRRCRLLD